MNASLFGTRVAKTAISRGSNSTYSQLCLYQNSQESMTWAITRGPGKNFWKKIENTQEIAMGLASRLGPPERLNRISGAGIHEICQWEEGMILN